MLLPFLPRSPHLFAIPMSCAPSTLGLVVFELLLPGRRRGLEEPSCTGLGLPPSIEETEDWAHRACFRMTEVTEMHSFMTSDTGFTATDTGLLRNSALGA
jgi:hypothetical protein